MRLKYETLNARETRLTFVDTYVDGGAHDIAPLPFAAHRVEEYSCQVDTIDQTVPAVNFSQIGDTL